MDKQELEEIQNSERWFQIDDLDSEVWKNIINYEGIYQVSNIGRVKVLEQRRICVLNNKILKIFPGRIRRPSLDNSGYFGLKLFNGSKNYKPFKIHQLVAQNFLIKLENENQPQKWH